jgi:putative ubiquitin-RnfH superfamily antitoxin RatB of RatAB toxin-antitoxin module
MAPLARLGRASKAVVTPDLPEIEVVYASTDRQRVVGLPLTRGLTALEAVRASGLLEEFPEVDPAQLALGVWGRRVPAEQRLQPGDRVEIYRPLRFDPRAARREAVRASGLGTKGSKSRRR